VKGAVAFLLLTVGGVAAIVVISSVIAPESAEEIAARPGLAWERTLPVRSGLTDESRIEPTLGRMASRIAGHRVRLSCWSEDDWEVVSAEWQAQGGREDWWPAGFADPSTNSAHLSSHVCRPLSRFVYGRHEPFGNTQSLELAEALVVLAHEAEHLYDPEASEARVECLAMQDVRELVTRSGRSGSYASEMAGLAYDIAYPHLDSTYRSRHCRNGGRLDRHPDSEIWP
jgi:hypothetical protein